MARKNRWKKPAWLKEKIAMDKSMQSRQEDCDFFLKDMYPMKRGILIRAIKKSKKAIKRLGIRI